MQDYTDITVCCVDGSVRWSKYVISVNFPALCPLGDFINIPLSVAQICALIDVINGRVNEDDGAILGAILWGAPMCSKNVTLALIKAYKYGTDVREKIKEILLMTRINDNLFAFMCAHFGDCIAQLIIDGKVEINKFPAQILNTSRTPEDLFIMSKMVKNGSVNVWKIVANRFVSFKSNPKNKHWFGCTLSYMIVIGVDRESIECMIGVRDDI